MNIKDWIRLNHGYTTVAVVIFIVVFLWGYFNEVEAAEYEGRLGLGTQATDREDRGKAITQDFMFTIDRDWYMEATRFGNGTVIPETWRFSAGRRVDWREETYFAPFVRLGAAYWLEPSVLVSENWTFDMAVGFRAWNIVEIEYQHNSTAGRSGKNTGVDIVGLYVVFDF